MGEYTIIVNLTKQEFIGAEAFNGGPKLAEMCESSGGILRGLAILLADCNGAGDYARTEQHNRLVTMAPAKGEKIVRSTAGIVAGDIVYTTFVPECSGSWSGDKIIVAGEYTADGVGMTKAMRDAAMKAWKANTIARKNLYHFAGFYFRDISEAVARQISAFDREGPDERFIRTVQRFFDEKLNADYGTLYIHDKKRPRRDLTWMDYECLDSFMMIFNETKEDLKAAKAWFRKQEILPWQRAMISLYSNRDHENAINMGRPALSQRQAVYNKYNIPDDPETKLLPSRKIIEAALKMEARLATGSEKHEIVADETSNNLAAALGVAGRESRMIDVAPQEEEVHGQVSQTAHGPRRANHARKRDKGRTADANH